MSLLNRRVGRVGFALGYLPILGLIFALVLRSNGARWHVGDDPQRLVMFLAIFAWSVLITAWRCHDYGKSAWSNFWTEQIPLVGPFLGLWDLLSKPGDTGHNAYGPTPRF